MSNRISSGRFRPRVEALEARDVPSAALTGPSSSQSPYLTPTAPGIEITSILTVGDTVTDTYANGPALADYRMVGIPDGLGAFDNGDGTFTVVMNHELGSTVGITRDHGSAGAFVSRWVIRKSDLAVLEGDDLIKTMKLWDGSAYITGTTAMNRLCSADLPPVTAFYNAATGNGTTVRIFMNGEESGTEGRAFASLVTGPNAGTTYQLPSLGRFAWENSVANPYAQDTTIVAGLDDGTGGQVYFYVGTKTNTGTEIEKAGLSGGKLYGLKVTGVTAEASATGIGAGPKAFTLADLGDVANKTGAQLNADSVTAGVTSFLRPEDGAWDPNSPNAFYFVTTNGFGVPSRLWKAHFNDLSDPAAGGTIEELLSTTAIGGNMFDNLTVDGGGRVLIQEDPGNQTYVAKVWRYDTDTGEVIQIAEHDRNRFDPNLDGAGVPGPNFLTRDEESSGIISLEHILGKGRYLAVVQAHYNPNTGDPELVEGGQLLLINTNAATATQSGGVLTVEGTIDGDALTVTKHGNTLIATDGLRVLGTFDARTVDTIVVNAANGNDLVYIAPNVQANAVVLGGAGNDLLYSGAGRSILVGGAGSDLLIGGSDSDILIGGDTSLTADQLVNDVLAVWVGNKNYSQRVAALQTVLAPTVTDDGETDWLFGRGSKDWYFIGEDDKDDAKKGETRS